MMSNDTLEKLVRGIAANAGSDVVEEDEALAGGDEVVEAGNYEATNEPEEEADDAEALDNEADDDDVIEAGNDEAVNEPEEKAAETDEEAANEAGKAASRAHLSFPH